MHFHGDRYELDCYVIMPNHVHVLFRPLGEHRMEEILQSWKRFSARKINLLLQKTGNLWQREYWDRLIRTQKQFDWTRNYIMQNPVKLPRGTFTLWRRGFPSSDS